MATEFSAEVQSALERTGGIDLLDQLGEVYPSERAHSERVADMSMHATLKLGESSDNVVLAGFAGSLHDVGKVDERIQGLVKVPRKLTMPERVEVRERHTVLGKSLINALKVSEQDAILQSEAAFTAFFHHYPPERLLKLAAGLPVVRVIQIVDQFDAVQDVDRPYHAGDVLSAEDTISQIRNNLEMVGAHDELAESTLGILREASADQR